MTQQPWGQPKRHRSQPGFGQPGFGQPGFGQPGGQWSQQGFGQRYGEQYGVPPAGFGQQRPGQWSPYRGGFAPPQPGQLPRPPARKQSAVGRVLSVTIALTVVAIGVLILTWMTQGTTDTAYHNEDYQVPPASKEAPPLPPGPQTVDEAVAMLTKNKFYAQQVPAPVRCNAAPIDFATATDPEIQQKLDATIGCLMRVWGPSVEAAGYQLPRPTVTLYSRSIQTACGNAKPNAFYCAADQQVYFSNLLPQSSALRIVKEPFVADMVMAHEFGHALQGRTGILIAFHALMQNTNDKSESLELSRRGETQADCFSGQSINSIKKSLNITSQDLTSILVAYRSIGDDHLTGDASVVGNHGRSDSRQYWGRVGLNNTDIAKCDTFSVSASKVR